MKSRLLTLEDAQERLFALAPAMPVETVELEQAAGRFLARPLKARRTQPTCDTSAMDGYAVPRGDLTGPWRIIGESAAGHPFAGHVSAGEAVRISTGAALPDGASHVIVQEDVTVADGRLVLTGEGPIPPSKHVRARGSDFEREALVLPAGTHMGAAQIALAVTAGHLHVPITSVPTVAIIDSGDELLTEGSAPSDHQMPASNGIMLATGVRLLGARAHRLGPIKDDLARLVASFDRCGDADVIVTSGGASVGDHDLIRPALEAWGAKLDFWRVAIKPGKPILVATRERPGQTTQLIIGLPGNPVSCYVTAYLFLQPLLRRMMGAGRVVPQAIRTTLGADLPPTGRRREFLRGFWNGIVVTPAGTQDSGALSALSMSTVLIDRPPDAPAVAAGALVQIFLLQNGGIL